MRILHVMASRVNGGAETYSADMMESLHGFGVKQMLIVPRQSIHHDRLAAAGACVDNTVLSMPLNLARRYRLARLINNFQPDLVHCWMRRAASIVPRRTAVPVVGWFGGYYDPRHFEVCDHLVGVTKGIVQHMLDRGVSIDRAHFVPTFPTIEDAEPATRRQFDTPEDAIVLLALSRLHVKKGLDILLRALKELPACIVWLAGDGPLEGELKALAHHLGVAERVRFLGWRTDRGALLRAADICVLPSRYEPFGTVMLEAWAAKTPLVAAASQGPAALIESGKNGMLVPIDDVPALAGAISRVINGRELWDRLIANGFAEYRNHYTRESVTERMLSLYGQIINEHNSLIARGTNLFPSQSRRQKSWGTSLTSI